jgi:hypothetical protein
MTLYRDDIQETIIYSNNTLAKSKTITDEFVRISEGALHRLNAFTLEALIVSDEVIDSSIFPVIDTVAVTDEWTGRKLHRDLLVEQVIVGDAVQARLRAQSLITEIVSSESQPTESQRITNIDEIFAIDQFAGKKLSTFQFIESIAVNDYFRARAQLKESIVNNVDISDSTTDKLRGFTQENITFQEQHLGKKITRSIIDESVQAKGGSVAYYSDLVTDQIFCSEQHSQRLIVKQQITDSILLGENFNLLRKVSQKISESITTSDISQSKNKAKQWINDLIFAEDAYDKNAQYGYAWTANVDTWAMSRYQDYGFSELAVIDGVLYGIATDGVYRIDANEQVRASIVTGKIDLGQGQLIHPLGAYLEYELSGTSKSIEVGVSTTQSGIKQTYFYPLAAEVAGHLTNGRVLFGRGLRGRHFSFEIKISGEHGYINDFSIDMTATKRRV